MISVKFYPAAQFGVLEILKFLIAFIRESRLEREPKIFIKAGEPFFDIMLSKNSSALPTCPQAHSKILSASASGATSCERENLLFAVAETYDEILSSEYQRDHERAAMLLA